MSAEFFSIVIAFAIFLITHNARKYIKSNYLIILGYAYLFIGILDFLHAVGFKGMNIFSDYDYYANQLWIANRFFESIILIVSLSSNKWKFKVNIVGYFTILLVVTSLILISIFPTNIFPECYTVNQGQTEFKIISEYVIIVLLMISLIILYRQKKYFEKEIMRDLYYSLIFTIFSELSFTLYVDNYGFFNFKRQEFPHL